MSMYVQKTAEFSAIYPTRVHNPPRFYELEVYGCPFYELWFGTQGTDVQGLNFDGF